jgi:metal-sulfur cluster biosynthetic enzyme
VDVDADRIATIDMTLTSAACPLTDMIEDQARVALDGVVPDFRINWVWMPNGARRTSPKTTASNSGPRASTSNYRGQPLLLGGGCTTRGR